MAKLSNLQTGQTYPVKNGPYAGKMAEVLTTTVEPDDSPNARKIVVHIDGYNVYILPRQLDDGVPTPAEAVALRSVLPLVQQPDMVAYAQQVEPARVAVAPPPAVAPVEEHQPLTSPDDPRLDAYRPDPSVVDAYIPRTMPGGRTDIEVCLAYWREKENLMLVGDTQSGKTMLVQVLAVLAAKEAGYEKPFPVFTLSGSDGISNFELFGQSVPYINPDTGREELVWLPGVVSLSAAAGGFLYIDEVSAMDPRSTQAVHPLCDSRRCFINYSRPVKVPGDGFVPEMVKANPELWIVGTYNENYRGTGNLSEAFVNRFTTLVHNYSDEVEDVLITSKAVKVLALALRTARDNHQINSPVGTRLLQRLQVTALEHGAEFALFAFLGSFPSRDRERVETIIRERSIEMMLQDEVSHTRPAEVAS